MGTKGPEPQPAPSPTAPSNSTNTKARGGAERFNTDQFWEKMAKEAQWRAGGRPLYFLRHVAWTQP
jgi:hypothetical protein